MSELWEKELWTNPNIMYSFNSIINEFDIKQAGYSIVREFKQLDPTKIAKLERQSKDARHKQIGVWLRDDREFAKVHKEGFKEARRRFFTENSLDEENILAIKKDAVFVKGDVDHTEVGEFIDFRKKNRYTSYIRLPNKIELYYYDGKIDVKGISSENVETHEGGILDFLKIIFRKIETDTQEVQLRVLMRYLNDYKARTLPVNYYREFNSSSKIIVADPESMLTFDDYWEDRKDELSVQYNYFNVFIPILKMIT